MAPKVLFIYNDPTAPEALLGDAFTERGFDVEVFTAVPEDRVDHPAFDVEFPDPTGYDVIVPLGSRFSVHDEALGRTWVGAEMAMVRDAAAAGVGVLGVCFGGQLVAQAFGGTVSRSPAPEIGWYELDSSDPGLIPAGPWFQWHFDRFSTPPGATELARTAGATQAFVLGRTMGLQFHPELDAPLLDLWIAHDHDDELGRLGLTAAGLRAATAAERDAAVSRLRALVAAFLDRVAADTSGAVAQS
ncbi:type 1 glutamine amidotransferase [Mycolicibacterium palauense]|uniref:type 1 glutamine amidotransferase n=1 Tax=Mycolicibacterium palauense TaxID=2034511 RepID=UPI000BFEDB62|nr:type 1 glutamine amidotransferase [Mycolicibacterium palauense]